MEFRHLAVPFALGLWWAATPVAAQTATPQQIDVVANDYAFTPLPTTVVAGPTVFTFVNKGTVQHEMSVGRLRSGATVEDMLKIAKDGGRMRDVMERSVGILIAGPGKSPDGRLLVDLLPGATYVMVCNLRDKPESPPHMTMGMYATFTPQSRR